MKPHPNLHPLTARSSKHRPVEHAKKTRLRPSLAGDIVAVFVLFQLLQSLAVLVVFVAVVEVFEETQ